MLSEPIATGCSAYFKVIADMTQPASKNAMKKNALKIDGLEHASKTKPTVTPDGRALGTLIHGVQVRYPVSHIDARGSLTELFRTDWLEDLAPIKHSYLATIRPGVVKGWNIHLEHDDRLFTLLGSLKIVLYDGREHSPTRGLINELFFGMERRGFVYIPRHIYHAVQNIGLVDAAYVGFPSEPYKHQDPDKFTLPADTDVIPYRFTRE